jgi:hypothetical protein
MNFLENYSDFLVNEGFFSSMKIEPGKTFVVTKKLQAENRANGDLYYFKPGEIIENILGVKAGYVIFKKELVDKTFIEYAIKEKDFTKSVKAEVEFPRKTIISNLAEIVGILKNLNNETSYKDRKDLVKKLEKNLSKKSDDEIKTLINSLYNFNITFSKFEM